MDLSPGSCSPGLLLNYAEFKAQGSNTYVPTQQIVDCYAKNELGQNQSLYLLRSLSDHTQRLFLGIAKLKA